MDVPADIRALHPDWTEAMWADIAAQGPNGHWGWYRQSVQAALAHPLGDYELARYLDGEYCGTTNAEQCLLIAFQTGMAPERFVEGMEEMLAEARAEEALRLMAKAFE